MKIRLCLIELNFYERLPTISTRVSLLIILKTPCFSDNNLCIFFLGQFNQAFMITKKERINQNKEKKETIKSSKMSVKSQVVRVNKQSNVFAKKLPLKIMKITINLTSSKMNIKSSSTSKQTIKRVCLKFEFESRVWMESLNNLL